MVPIDAVPATDNASESVAAPVTARVVRVPTLVRLEFTTPEPSVSVLSTLVLPMTKDFCVLMIVTSLLKVAEDEQYKLPATVALEPSVRIPFTVRPVRVPTLVKFEFTIAELRVSLDITCVPPMLIVALLPKAKDPDVLISPAMIFPLLTVIAEADVIPPATLIAPLKVIPAPLMSPLLTVRDDNVPILVKPGADVMADAKDVAVMTCVPPMLMVALLPKAKDPDVLMPAAIMFPLLTLIADADVIPPATLSAPLRFIPAPTMFPLLTVRDDNVPTLVSPGADVMADAKDVAVMTCVPPMLIVAPLPKANDPDVLMSAAIMFPLLTVRDDNIPTLVRFEFTTPAPKLVLDSTVVPEIWYVLPPLTFTFPYVTLPAANDPAVIVPLTIRLPSVPTLVRLELTTPEPRVVPPNTCAPFT
jgi:hypothetical protein